MIKKYQKICSSNQNLSPELFSLPTGCSRQAFQLAEFPVSPSRWYLGWQQGQPDVGEKHSQVPLAVLQIVPHPHHQGLENGFFIWHVDVVARQELGNFISWEQKKFLVFYYFYEVFLKIKEDFNALMIFTHRNSFFLDSVGSVYISFSFCSTIQGNAVGILKITERPSAIEARFWLLFAASLLQI